MGMNREFPAHILAQPVCLFLCALLCTASPRHPRNSQPSSRQSYSSLSFVEEPALLDSDAADDKSTGESNLAIPSGTILPVRLNSTISSAKSTPGQVIAGRIMQDVPLSPGVKIRAGSKVIGHIIEVTSASTGANARISLQFDKLVASHQTIPITTNLRAIAGFMQILEAQTPTIGPGESDVFRWLTTVQVGGDVVYGEGGPVTSERNADLILGRKLNDGVLGQVRAKEGTKCRGAIDGNDSPQALWVFSTDACGTYGLEHISITHAGRTDPTGIIVLASDSGNVKIPAGTGMLLRVNANHTRVDSSKFEDIHVEGAPRSVFSRGRAVIDAGQLAGGPGVGQFLLRDTYAGI
jgi:hypothetical protein